MKKSLKLLTKKIQKLKIWFAQFPLFNFSLGFCLGNIITSKSVAIQSTIVIAVLSLIILLLLKIEIKTILLFVLASFLGALNFQYFQHRESSSDIENLYNLEIELVGKIVQEVHKESNSCKAVIMIEDADTRGIEKGASMSKIRVLIRTGERCELEYGDQIKVSGTLEEPPNFDTFSYKEYLRAQGIYAVMKADTASILEVKKSYNLLSNIKRFKYEVKKKITKALPSPHDQLLAGVLFGVKGSMSEEFEESLRRTGTSHIIAVSGYNVTLLVSTIGIFASLIGRKWLNITSILFIFIFIFFVGVDNIPVIRSGLMGTALIVGKLFGKKNSAVIFLPFVVAILHVFQPLTFELLSFQLSFVATLGIMLLNPFFSRMLNFAPAFLKDDLSSTISAILCTLPITILNFGEVSLVAPIANLFVLPITSFVTVFGMIVTIGMILKLPFINLTIYSIWILLHYVISVIKIFGNLGFAVVTVSRSAGNLITIVPVATIFLVLISKNEK